MPFFPFTSEPESEHSLFSFSNYDFQGSFGFHLDELSDISHLPDISDNFDSRTYISFDSLFNTCNLPFFKVVTRLRLPMMVSILTSTSLSYPSLKTMLVEAST